MVTPATSEYNYKYTPSQTSFQTVQKKSILQCQIVIHFSFKNFQLYDTKLAGKIPTWPFNSPSHQSYWESVLVTTVIRSPALKLRSPGCWPVNGWTAVTTRAPPDAWSVTHRDRDRERGLLKEHFKIAYLIKKKTGVMETVMLDC